MAAQLIEMSNKDPEFFDKVMEQLPVDEQSYITDAISYTDLSVCWSHMCFLGNVVFLLDIESYLCQ